MENNAKKIILEDLSHSPKILRDLVMGISPSALKERRIPGKWSIHEHVCHLADVQQMLLKRFEKFKAERNPEFIPFLPGKTSPDDYLMEMDLEKSLDDFQSLRENQLTIIGSYTAEDWENEGHHPEYAHFNPEILARHVLMHDHLHMYRIEELWLTNTDFLRK